VKNLGTFTLVCAVMFGPPALGAAQEQKPAAEAAAPQAMPPLPKPGPEHAVFNDSAGTWDARVEMFMAPGAEPSVSKGVETSRVGCGGLCLITDFKGSFSMDPSAPPVSFEGHGIDAYDQAKKKYVGTWIDSMSTGPMIGESTYDPASRTFTGWSEAPDMSGKLSRMKSTVTMKDADTRVFSMYNLGPDGKETLGMRITYTRKK
jgi:hypothetical protein